jgi:aryl-alcohol dehydrogenase-like predicted oxidoreductase
MGITSFYGRPMPDAEAVALVAHAFANGITHFDTAEVYTALADDGTTTLFNESVVGTALAALGCDRAAFQIATKYYPALHGPTMTAEDVLGACKASCARLGVASVDLYYVHRLHASVPVEDQARAMLAAKEAGLCTHVGVSEFSPANLRAFHAICPVTCVQQEWSLVNRDLEEELVPVCRELGIGIVAYSPLCRSLLCGAVKGAADLNGPADLRPSRYPRFAPENLARNGRKRAAAPLCFSSRARTCAFALSPGG